MPAFIRWPGHIKPGTVVNEIGAHEDWLPTLLAAAGDPTVKEKLLKGYTVGGTTYKVHLDGYNLLPAFKGEGAWPRKEFLYWTDDGGVAALRYNNWKVTFLVQRAHGMDVWREPFVALRAPILVNLRMDPFERAKRRSRGLLAVVWRSTCSRSLPPAMYVGSGFELPRVPAAPEARQLQPRQGDGDDDGGAAVEVAMAHRLGD